MLKKNVMLWTLTMLFMAGAACDGSSQTSPLLGENGVQLEPAFPALAFTRPVDLQHPGDGSGRLFVVEQEGVINVFENRQDVADASVFLDIRERVNDESNEQGLLGLAFHPDFEENGYFYVDYTAADPNRTVIARYEVDPENPDAALPGSEQVILEVEQPYGNHNAGQIVFGPEGYLYVTLGDGGAGGDPQENGQDPTTLLASILRIDVDRPADGKNYGIPPDNPFVGNDRGWREEIWAYGLRNPWRISFDPETQALWTGDVGQNAYEEISIIEKGQNYGWNTMEASHCFDPETGCDQTGLVLPVHEYPHEVGRSITGGFVYRAAEVPALAGQYVFADYTGKQVWALDAENPRDAEPAKLMDFGAAIASFGVDAQGELYACAFDGKIYRFTSSAAGS